MVDFIYDQKSYLTRDEFIKKYNEDSIDENYRLKSFSDFSYLRKNLIER